MRRYLFPCLGALELAAAIGLLVLAISLPGAADVDEVCDRFEKVSRNAGRQVGFLRDQVAVMRRQQPKLLTLSRRLEKQMRSVSASVQQRGLDGSVLTTVSDALGNVATGLDGLATTFDPKTVDQIGKGLTATADFLDGKVMPAAEKAATALDDAGKSLKTDAGRLKDLLSDSPVELKAARAMVESLTKFEDGLKEMKSAVKLDNFDAMREGFKGLETSLDSGAEQVEKVADYTIPKVTIKGLKISVEQKDFWPEGKTIAEGMRKGAKGCQAAGKEMDALKKRLPKLSQSLEESQKVVTATRKALASALASQEKLEPVLTSLPKSLSRLSSELRALTTELAKVLRETSRLKEVAVALRQTEKNVNTAAKRWPQLRETLEKSGTLLRATQKQLGKALSHRDDFENTMRQTVELTTMFAEALPILLEQMEEGLGRQEDSLAELRESIDRVSEAVPAAGQTAGRLLGITRALLSVVALLVGLHAGYVLVGGRAKALT